MRLHRIIDLAVSISWLRLLLLGVLAGLGAACSSVHSTSAYTLVDPDIDEASGIVASQQHPGVYWIVNDGGNGPYVFASNEQGASLSRLHIDGVQNVDWEDLAIYSDASGNWLVIADVGDNRAVRGEVRLHFVAEPKVLQAEMSLRVERTLTFTYEDGPRDVESVAIDVARQQLLLLSKRDFPPVLYQLSLMGSDRQVAQRMGAINTLPQQANPDPRHAHYLSYGTQPTAMDISPQGDVAVVLTYTGAYRFDRSQGEDWLAVLSKPDRVIALPYLYQAESVAITADGQHVLATSEKLPAPLVKVGLQGQAVQAD